MSRRPSESSNVASGMVPRPHHTPVNSTQVRNGRVKLAIWRIMPGMRRQSALLSILKGWPMKVAVVAVVMQYFGLLGGTIQAEYTKQQLHLRQAPLKSILKYLQSRFYRCRLKKLAKLKIVHNSEERSLFFVKWVSINFVRTAEVNP